MRKREGLLSRCVQWGIAVLLVFGLGTTATAETLRIASWGGAYVRSQIHGFIRDYEEETGVRVEIIEYAGGIDAVRSQVRSHNVRWDVVDFELFDAIRAGREGLLEPVDPDDLAPAPDGTPAREDFIDGSIMEFGVGNIVYSTVIAYNRAQHPAAPTRLEDLFDLEAFPGERTLRQTPVGNLEWALIADGVDPDSVYAVLETEAGVQRALRKLNDIKAVVRWWTDGEQAIAWLELGEVTMGSVYNGRAFDAKRRGAPIEIVWDRQITALDVWGIPKHGRNTDRAREFVRFATSTRRLANQTRYIAYGPVRRSSMEYVPEDVRPYLPSAPENLRTAFHSDPEWWAEHFDRINSRFERWLRFPARVPSRLRR